MNIIEEPRKLISIEEYDANGNLTKDERYNKEELIYRTLYFDLDEYRASKTEDFFKGVGGGGPGKPCDKPDNRYTFKSKYEYDKQGNRIKEEQYGNCNTLGSKLIYEYDSQGFLLEINRTTYLYKTKPPTMENKTTYKYDEKGNLIEQTINNTRTDAYSNYEFDKQGNWIKRNVKATTTFSSSISVSSWVEYRTITYY